MRTSAICALLSAVLMPIAMLLIFFYAPEEATLGIIQKIFYIHVPLAWWGLISYAVVFFASIHYIRTAKDAWDSLARASAEIGVLFTILTLATGMIWGRISWGVWWTWDPRLTTALVLFFLYAAYLIIDTLSMPPLQRKKVSAVLGIVAFINVPLVFFSAHLWRSIHPAVFTTKSVGLPPKILAVFLYTLCSFFFIWIAILTLRYAQLKLRDTLERSKQLL